MFTETQRSRKHEQGHIREHNKRLKTMKKLTEYLKDRRAKKFKKRTIDIREEIAELEAMIPIYAQICNAVHDHQDRRNYLNGISRLAVLRLRLSDILDGIALQHDILGD